MEEEEKPKKWNRPRKIKGLGDAVHVVANPIARGLDRVLGTDIEHCETCQQRRERLNQLLSFEEKE